MAKTKQSPGILLLGFLEKTGYNCNSLSKEIKCSQTALRLISLDKSRITTSIAVRLAKFFGTKPEFWLLAQMNYDLTKAAGKKSLQKQLKGISKASVGGGKSGKKRKTASKKKAGKRKIKRRK
jgi:addiction module HigA family antidote